MSYGIEVQTHAGLKNLTLVRGLRVVKTYSGTSTGNGNTNLGATYSDVFVVAEANDSYKEPPVVWLVGASLYWNAAASNKSGDWTAYVIGFV